MIADKNVWALADEMIRRHHDEAASEAALRAFELLYEGDRSGAEQWQRVADAIAFLGPRAAPSGKHLH